MAYFTSAKMASLATPRDPYPVDGRHMRAEPSQPGETLNLHRARIVIGIVSLQLNAHEVDARISKIN